MCAVVACVTDDAIKEDAMTSSTAAEPLADAQADEVRRAIRAHCERAQRRLRVLARERNDVLLAQALRSVNSAAELSSLPLHSC
jgi:BMFP domain-containing protein YqiC